MSIKRFAAFNTTSVVTSSIKQGNSIPDLRPCQRAYLGESNARRLLKRSYLTKKARERTTTLYTDEPIFALHEEAALEAAATAAAAPSLLSEAQSLGYSVQCYATFAEDERKRQEAETAEKEKLLLFHSINSSRHAEGREPLRLRRKLRRSRARYARCRGHSHVTFRIAGSAFRQSATHRSFSVRGVVVRRQVQTTSVRSCRWWWRE